ncbi:MAG: PHP domain-containing protein [Eubacteriales bacterium]|nr:PHP domain-containing protein [Eubacteriales bacterium]MDY4897578.1 PHP domain-containing protein [Eubacteriales bacterium]
MEIKHDIHTHTTLSRCCYDPKATVANYVRRAAELGHTVFGLSNHLWDEKVPGASGWYKNQMISYGLQQKECIPADTCGVKVICGTETEYFAAHDTLGMLAETAKQFDYVLVPHTHMHMRNNVMNDNADSLAVRKILADRIAAAIPELSAEQAKKMAWALGYGEMDTLVSNDTFFPHTVDMAEYCARFMVDSFNSLMANSEFEKLAKTVPTSIAHPFHPCGFSADMQKKIIDLIPDADLTDCFKKAQSMGVAIEINTGSFCHPANDYADEPLIRVMKLALAAGCRFTFGTDSHSLAGLDSIRKGNDISRLVGITQSNLADIVK